MAVRYIGDADYVHPEGGSATFRVFNAEGALFAVVQNSLLDSFNVRQSVTGASHFDISLKCSPEDDFSGIPEAAMVEMFVCSSKPPAVSSNRLLAGIVDYCETQSERDADGKRFVKLQGRSVWGQLIDAPARGEVRGKLGESFAALSQNFAAIVDRSEITETELELSVNCPSSYKAMRLLALSFDCVVQNEDDSLIVDTVRGAKDRLDAKQRLTLTDKDIIAAKLRRGSPIRRRDDDNAD